MKTFSLKDEKSIQEAQVCFSSDGSEIRYKQLFEFIHQVLIPSIQTNMNWSTCRWSKLRISDNNNNTDAAIFHRDLICYDPEEKDFPIYTCLCYLDEGAMEIISDSHLDNENHQFLKKQQMQMSAGDVLIFKSNTLHRGIFPSGNQKQKHRRLIQLFDCFRNEADYHHYFPKILFVPARSSHGKKYQFWTSFPLIYPILNYLAYMNASSGYNPQKIKKWLAKHYPNSFLISSDAEQTRWDYDWEKETQSTNLYIYPEHTRHVDLKEEHHKILKRMQYVHPLAFYACLLILPFFVLLLFLLCLFIRSKK